jgi:hypothetical protein
MGLSCIGVSYPFEHHKNKFYNELSNKFIALAMSSEVLLICQAYSGGVSGLAGPLFILSAKITGS